MPGCTPGVSQGWFRSDTLGGMCPEGAEDSLWVSIAGLSCHSARYGRNPILNARA